MLGTEFLAAYAGKGPSVWESAAVDLVRQGFFVSWPMLPVTVTDGKHNAVVNVALDYFCVGTAQDFLRLPLTPGTAQTIADVLGYVISTPKIVKATWEQALVKLSPVPAPALPSRRQNMGADLSQYAEHQAAVQAQLGGQTPQGIVSGHQKDVVLSSIMKPGKVVIYGWFSPERVGLSCKADGSGQPIQCLSNVHGDFYVDYSHGIRYVQPQMILDGLAADVRTILQDKTLCRVLNDEGVCPVRYPSKGNPAPVTGTASSLADLGALVVRERMGMS